MATEMEQTNIVQSPEYEEEAEFQDAFPTGGPLGEKKNRTWADVARVIGNEAIYERLQSYWEFVGATSGFIAGFSFVVTTDTIDFPYGDGIVITTEIREILFGMFAGLTFLISLCATLFAAILYSALNLSGQENAVWFAQEFW
eukprot:CAMPEP_0201591866 /NCGR_PEP_ID=MMETSP0190_2-20130828/189915_1 /ASSEMBLY_ACC=CAM_ASM_000263 /TAXON_ID=37353 /ORGANISM="Rosalina sp." /LENGTH=142 /DNA_ID=CAMNT_0048050371 /DNA_START=97 /DNA_END=522 /DNA_ORIENTATION=+